MTKFEVLLCYANVLAAFMSAMAGEVNWISILVIIYLLAVGEIRSRS